MAWSFVHVTDIHVGSPRSFRFEPAWNENWSTARRQIIELCPDLLLVGGDLTRDGALHRFELEAIKADLDTLPCPYHIVPGNMDTGNKWAEVASRDRDDSSLNMTSEQFRQFVDIFGPTQWSFVHNGVRFRGFCDILAGSKLPEERELWNWLERRRDEPKDRFCVWLTHYPLFLDRPDEGNFDVRDSDHYLDWYFGIDEPWRSRLLESIHAAGADWVLSGHVHCRRTRIVDGVRFLIGPSSAFPQWEDRWPDGDPTLGFMHFVVNEDTIESDFIPLAERSTSKGYGPGGHPTPEQWDYSLAWQPPGTNP
jgi:3',5'-cyclic AMP phosphodiesterase CpdA